MTDPATVEECQSPKSANKMSKAELLAEVKYHRKNTVEQDKIIEELRREIQEINEKLERLTSAPMESYNPHNKMKPRIIELERRLAEQEQYSRRECMEIVGLPDDTTDDELKDLVVDTFATAGVAVDRNSFHANYRLKNRKIIIAKLIN